MRDFYFKDKASGSAFRGITPSNDEDCPPFDYYTGYRMQNLRIKLSLSK